MPQNSSQSLPWLTHKLKRMIKTRNKLSKKALKSGDPLAWQSLKTSRTNTKKALSAAYNNYLQSIIGNHKEAPRKFYKFIRSKQTEHAGISCLTFNGVPTTEDSSMASVLNSHFTTSFTHEDVNYTACINGLLKTLPNL